MIGSGSDWGVLSPEAALGSGEDMDFTEKKRREGVEVIKGVGG